MSLRSSGRGDGPFGLHRSGVRGDANMEVGGNIATLYTYNTLLFVLSFMCIWKFKTVGDRSTLIKSPLVTIKYTYLEG